MSACLKMIKVRHGEYTYTVPCGKCGFCLETKRSQWMFRVHYEMKTQEYPGWFITLTYQPKYVKRVADGRLSLRFTDVQKFFKKLRKAKYYAKYICVGEYGGQTKRPHYHVLLWSDCPAHTFERYWTTKEGHLLGQIHIGRISMQSAMYTLKYIIQPKQKAEGGIEKTRAQFSRGLGLNYLSSAVYNYHTMDYENPVFTSRIDGRKLALPRYYRQKIFTKYQTRLEGERIRLESIKNKWTQVRDLIGQGSFEKSLQGRKDALIYMQRVRNDQAARVIEKSKLNTKL